MKLTKSQTKSVEKIFDAFLKRGENKKCYFKAPTGSGKTLMASTFISKVMAEIVSRGKKPIVIVSTISSSDLPEEFSNKLKKYKKFHEYNDYKIEYISSPSNSKTAKFEDYNGFDLISNVVYVFGLSSFRKGTIFNEYETFKTFLSEKNSNENFELIYIRDEAHIGMETKITKKLKENFDNLAIANSEFILAMTATPSNDGSYIELTKKDLLNDDVNLLKNRSIPLRLTGEISNEELIDESIRVFKESKKEYQKLSNEINEIINPAMLIQVDNESNTSPERQMLFEENIELLKTKLDKAGLKYLIYFSKEKSQVFGSSLPNTLSYASKSNSLIDVIIFKVGPAVGWDIPRANMLLQLRHVSSDNLKMQTIGRILRNPMPGLEYNEVTDKYYLFSYYGNTQTRDSITYEIKDKFKQKKLLKGYLNKESEKFIEDDKKFYKELNEFICGDIFKGKLKDLTKNEIIYDQNSYGNLIIKNEIKNFFYLKIYNIEKEKEYSKIFNIKNIMDSLNDVCFSENKSIELGKFLLFKSIIEIKEIKAKNSKWIENIDSYKIESSDVLMQKYNIWKDNEDPKLFDTSEYLNYGYEQIGQDEFIQYLDSGPELAFAENFKNMTSKNEKDKITFYAKMPTLGSPIYFEYHSKKSAMNKKSYMDFAVEYKEFLAMIEVKSYDNDYDSEKTEELLEAYKNYMKKYGDEKISLILFQWDKKTKTSYINMLYNNEWKTIHSFREIIEYIETKIKNI